MHAYILKKFYGGEFEQETISLFKLGWLFYFSKDQGAGRSPIVAGNRWRKLAGKVLSIEYRLPWKEAAGTKQYGLNTPDGVNMHANHRRSYPLIRRHVCNGGRRQKHLQ